MITNLAQLIAHGFAKLTGAQRQVGATQPLAATASNTVVLPSGDQLTNVHVGLPDVDNTSNATERAAVATLTNKTVSLGSNTVSGTLAQFNTAVTDADFVSLAGTETLTNKTLTNPVIDGFTGSTAAINIGSGQIVKDTSGNVTFGAGTFGYGAGAGGTGTVAAGAVNIPKPNGLITLNTASLAAGASELFNLTNTFIAVGDHVVLTVDNSSFGDKYRADIWYIGTALAGVRVTNVSASSRGVDALTIRFAVIKGSTT